MLRNQKKYVIALGALMLVAVGLSSCKKYLDLQPYNSNTGASVFSSIPNVQKAVQGVYGALLGDASYGIRLSLYYPYDSDDMTMNSATGNGRGDLAHFALGAGNTELSAPFKKLYTGIEDANNVIKNIPITIALYANGLEEQKRELRALKGECLTLRALYLHELIRNWGDVPASFIPSADLPSLETPQRNRFETYDSLLSQLLVAEDLVPWRSEFGGNSNRIYKGFVKGLRARIALYRAGWSENPATGVMERKSDYKDYYKIAMDECRDIIAHNEYYLSSNYESVFKDGICAHQYINNEVMFEAEMILGGGGTTDSKLGYANGPQTQGGVGNGYIRPLPTYFYMFDSADTRRNTTIALHRTGEYGSAASLTNITPVTTITGIYDGKYRRDWIRNPLPIPGQYPGGINWIIMRYSDVLLMYAEAYNEYYGSPTGGGSPTAKDAYEQVRKRAFGTADIGTTPTTKDAFFNAIVKERALEFGGEGIRKYDLIRWNLLTTRINQTKADLTALSIATRDDVPFPAPYTNYPKSMYAKAVSGRLVFFNSFYQLTPNSTDVALATAQGYSKITWLSGIYSSASTDPSKRASLYLNFAIGFNPAIHHLLPFPQDAMNTNSKLKQNFGY